MDLVVGMLHGYSGLNPDSAPRYPSGCRYFEVHVCQGVVAAAPCPVYSPTYHLLDTSCLKGGLNKHGVGEASSSPKKAELAIFTTIPREWSFMNNMEFPFTDAINPKPCPLVQLLIFSFLNSPIRFLLNLPSIFTKYSTLRVGLERRLLLAACFPPALFY